jgi:hypothetical protein
MNTMTKSKSGREGFIWLTFPCDSSSLKEVRTGTQSGQESRSRSWCRGDGGVLLTDLLSMACSACFLIESKTISPGVASSPMSRVPPQQSLIKKLPYRLAYSPILGRPGLNWGSLISDNSVSHQIDVKLSSTHLYSYFTQWKSLPYLTDELSGVPCWARNNMHHFLVQKSKEEGNYKGFLPSLPLLLRSLY